MHCGPFSPRFPLFRFALCPLLLRKNRKEKHSVRCNIWITGIALLQGCAITKSDVQNFLRPMEFAPVVGGIAIMTNAAITLSDAVSDVASTKELIAAQLEQQDSGWWNETQAFANISSAN